MKPFFYIQDWNNDEFIEQYNTQALEMGIPEEQIFIESILSKTRPMYNNMKQSLQSGDLLYVPSLYHFGRTQQMLATEWKELTQHKQVEIIVLNSPLLNTLQQKTSHINDISPFDFMLSFLYYLADEEQYDRQKRQQAGFATARQTGVKIGRKKIEITDIFISVYQQWKQNKIKAVEAMERVEMKPNTFYRRVREYESLLSKLDT
ncbi:recombinase family protein [Bacillus cereus]|uniref:recombinase family protein n=1 Tax=Bacillus cereus TaxID=1396 RepID=UPI0028525981|nr:recombinase family protein [Bacillus cereus]WLE91099.1 hypothetical protein GGBNIMDK_00130 [Bacillus cereus]